MKTKATLLGSIVLSALLAACSSTHYISIETYKPAEVTFPENVGKIVIANNAVTQPAEFGHVKKMYGRMSTDTIPTDSAVWDACTVLGQIIAEQKYFNDVLLYHDTIRHDSAYFVDRKLTPQQVKKICRETGADAVLSVDRMLFSVRSDVSAMSGGYVIGEVNVQVTGLLRSYLPNRANPLVTVQLADSAYWNTDADNEIILRRYLPFGNDAVREAAKHVISKTYNNFVPHWQEEVRWYYHAGGSRWKEATAFARKEKWDDAALHWERFYQTEKSREKRAKAALNLALANELKGDFEKALDWGNKGMTLFKEGGEEKNEKDIQLSQLYINTLMLRIRENQKLNIQFGQE